MSTDHVQQDTEEWYRQYYAKHGQDRNSPLNPEVTLQIMAADLAMRKAFQVAGAKPLEDKLLDVGCGKGQSLFLPLVLEFPASNLHGIDIQPERIEMAAKRIPDAHIVCDDASNMPQFTDGQFDIVTSSTMFVQLTDDVLAGKIASEMVRAVKPGQAILILDWRYNKPGDSTYLALDRRRLGRLFGVGKATRIEAVIPAALVPPIGRRLSKRGYLATYFAVQRLLPFLVGQVVYVLRKV